MGGGVAFRKLLPRTDSRRGFMEIKKCPNCGSVIESFQTRCSACGFELTGQKVSDTLQNFIAEISKWDDISYRNGDFNENKKKKSSVELKKIGTFSWVLLWLFGIAPFVILYRFVKKMTGNSRWSGLVWILLFVVLYGVVSISNGEVLLGMALLVGTLLVIILVYLGMAFFMKPVLTAVDKRKEQFIRNFVVPNSKEDILEFTSFAVTHIQETSKTKALFTADGKKNEYWNSIWRDKCKQLYLKARLSMRDDPDTLGMVKELMYEAGVQLS